MEAPQVNKSKQNEQTVAISATKKQER
jgi:hypothetical protein